MSLQKYYEEVLLEATNYLSMFNDFIGPDGNGEGRAKIKRYVDWAKQKLKKNDRIVWFLRFVKVELAGKFKNADMHAELEKLNKKLGTNYDYSDLIPINNLMTNLAHFLETPAPDLQKVVFNKQSPRELIEQMTQIEDDWKGTVDDDADAANMHKQGRLLPRNEYEHEIILQFPDGFTWFDLQTESCDQEAKAMGHCGNSAAARNGETILSLRKPVTHNSETKWYPVCTFILDRSGLLGEMKGRGNDKPAGRYHKYIVALLKLDIIKGIKGGGYMPENNFSMMDLPEDVRKKLIAKKPELEGIEAIYDREGMSKKVQSLVEDLLDGKNYPISDIEYFPEEKEFAVEDFRDFEQFLDFQGDDVCLKVLKVATDEELAAVNTREAFRDTVLDLPNFWQEKLMQKAGAQNIEEAIRKLMLTGDEYYNLFENMLYETKKMRDDAWERLVMYADCGWYFDNYHVYTNIPSDVQKLKEFILSDQRVKAMVSEQDLIYFASGDDNDDGDYNLYSSDGGGYSWTSNGNGNADERRYEDGLIIHTGKNRRGDYVDKWLNDLNEKGFDGSGEHNFVDEYVSVLSGRGSSSYTIDDERQGNLDLGDSAGVSKNNAYDESIDFNRILKLSGINESSGQ